MSGAVNGPIGRALNPSEPSNERCYIRFINKTARTVNVLWIDFGARFIKYTPLTNGQFVDVNTYRYHRWVAVDTKTCDALLLNGMFKYEPQTSQQYISEHVRANRDRVPEKLRILVYITVPLYSLYLKALLTVRDHVNNEEDVEGLELAKHIKEHLKSVVSRRNVGMVLFPLEIKEF